MKKLKTIISLNFENALARMMPPDVANEVRESLVSNIKMAFQEATALHLRIALGILLSDPEIPPDKIKSATESIYNLLLAEISPGKLCPVCNLKNRDKITSSVRLAQLSAAGKNKKNPRTPVKLLIALSVIESLPNVFMEEDAQIACKEKGVSPGTTREVLRLLKAEGEIDKTSIPYQKRKTKDFRKKFSYWGALDDKPVKIKIAQLRESITQGPKKAAVRQEGLRQMLNLDLGGFNKAKRAGDLPPPKFVEDKKMLKVQYWDPAEVRDWVVKTGFNPKKYEKNSPPGRKPSKATGK